jgi:hypothetical protein
VATKVVIASKVCLSQASFWRVDGEEGPCSGSGSVYSLSGIRISLSQLKKFSDPFLFRFGSIWFLDVLQLVHINT